MLYQQPATPGMPSDVIMRYQKASTIGFTLVELLIGLVLGAITIGMAAFVVSSFIRSTGKAIWVSQTEQDYGRISRFLKTEINEACLVQVSGSPATTATLPATPCTPASATPCATTSGTTLFLLVPVPLANGTATYRVISYTRSNDQLLRTGPPIAADGTLNTAAADVANVVIIDNLANLAAGFSPTVSTDCLSATIGFRFAIPNQGTTLDRNLTVSVGSPAMAN